MSATATVVTAADRFGFTLFLAAAVHGLIILGVGFGPLAPGADPPQALDVVVVQTHTDEAPDEADYLADADTAGGGDLDQRERPRAPVTSPEPEAVAGLAPVPLEAGAPRVQPHTHDPVLTAAVAEDRVPTEYEPVDSEIEHVRERPERIEYDAELAALAAEIDRALIDYAQRPRKQFVTARTRESPAAAYMHRWATEVERFGNLNYPEEARQQGLRGALILVVAIRADGSLHEIRLRASSGQSTLDNAARDIVRAAAPFEPFSDRLKEETDILYITRTWEFTSAHEVTTH